MHSLKKISIYFNLLSTHRSDSRHLRQRNDHRGSECPHFLTLNIREAHEHSEGMEEAAVMMTGLDRDRIAMALDVLQSQGRVEDNSLRTVADYMVSNVSKKVVWIILSYTDYVDRTVWHKE